MVHKVIIILVMVCLSLITAARNPVQPEKVIISTDREVYIAGDRLFFMVHLCDYGSKPDSYLYILLENSSGARIFDGCLRLENSHSYGSIYLADTLSSGIYQLVSFTNQMRNYGPLLYERKNILIANRFDNQFSGITGSIVRAANVTPDKRSSGKLPGSRPEIITGKEIYGKRERVTFTLQMPDDSRDQILSVTVRQAAPLSFVYPETTHEIPLSDDPCSYLSEKSGLILQGILKNETGNPLPDMSVFLSCEDTVPNLQHTLTNSDGIFRFFLNPYYFGKMLVIKSDQVFKGSIIINDKYENVKPYFQPLVEISGNLAFFLENSQKCLTILKSYRQDYRIEKINPAVDRGYRPAVYESAPQVVYPSDFIPLPDFIEISREILPLVKTRLHKNEYEAQLLGLDLNQFMRMFIFVDGILIEDVNQIISFDSGKIRKIEMMPYNRYLGNLHIPCILSIVSSRREIRNLRWNFPVEKIPADSIMHLSTYAPPLAENIPVYIPDFRQLLFWEPLPVSAGISEYRFETRTSDCTGKFEIVVTCCSEDGCRTEQRKEFIVMNQ